MMIANNAAYTPADPMPGKSLLHIVSVQKKIDAASFTTILQWVQVLAGHLKNIFQPEHGCCISALMQKRGQIH